MNIQEIPDAIKLCPYESIKEGSYTPYYIYYSPVSGMLYNVLADDGEITGQKYIIDTVFTPIN